MGIIEDLQAASKAQKASETALENAAGALAQTIEQVAPEGVELPRGYRVVRIKSNDGRLSPNAYPFSPKARSEN
jgi:hypothetical protein